MKITVSTGARTICIPIPTGLVCNAPLVMAWLRIGEKYAGEYMPSLSYEAVSALCREVSRIRKKHGAWELLEVESSEGQRIRIIL